MIVPNLFLIQDCAQGWGQSPHDLTRRPHPPRCARLPSPPRAVRSGPVRTVFVRALGEGEAVEREGFVPVGQVWSAVFACPEQDKHPQKHIRLPSPRRCSVEEHQRTTLHAVRERGWG